MSMTPHKVIDKKAVEERNSAIMMSLVFGFFSFVAFGNDAGGWGFGLGCFAFALFYYACTIKTVFHKRGEVGVYNK